MKRLLIIGAGLICIVLFFFVYTNPSTDSLKKELPGMLSMHPEDIKNCVSVGKTENWFVYSKFRVTCFPCDNVDRAWVIDYVGFAGNFSQVEPSGR